MGITRFDPKLAKLGYAKVEVSDSDRRVPLYYRDDVLDVLDGGNNIQLYPIIPEDQYIIPINKRLINRYPPLEQTLETSFSRLLLRGDFQRRVG